MDLTFRKYALLWNKYRPVVLNLMVHAANSPQKYKLAYHELRSIDNGKKDDFEFSMLISSSKAISNLRDPEIAKDLLSMLKLSRKGIELMAAHSYKIVLDRNFVLNVDQVA